MSEPFSAAFVPSHAGLASFETLVATSGHTVRSNEDLEADADERVWCDSFTDLVCLLA